eukprot:scaffold1604_cov315-Prasinococcus_capsulatus_cf.AAC.2
MAMQCDAGRASAEDAAAADADADADGDGRGAVHSPPAAARRRAHPLRVDETPSSRMLLRRFLRALWERTPSLAASRVAR